MQSHSENAAKIVSESRTNQVNAVDQATMVAVARIIMNLDEFVTRE